MHARLVVVGGVRYNVEGAKALEVLVQTPELAQHHYLEDAMTVLLRGGRRHAESVVEPSILLYAVVVYK